VEQMTPSKPEPRIDTVSRGFWDHARQHRLSVQRCDDCGDLHFPGSPVCPKCLSEAQSWAPVSGRGTVLSWVRFHRAYWEGFRADLPYLVALVGLEEGPMLVTNIVGADPASLAVGMAVSVVFEELDGEVTLPKFRLAG
jgi:uncharacterized OB-fold protein